VTWFLRMSYKTPSAHFYQVDKKNLYKYTVEHVLSRRSRKGAIVAAYDK